MVPLLVILSFIVLTIIGLILSKLKEKSPTIALNAKTPVTAARIFSKDSVRIPQEIYFSKGHTWLKIEKDYNAKVGIDEFLSRAIGKVVIRRIATVNKYLHRGEPFMELEIDGNILNILSPIEGKITSVNDTVAAESSMFERNLYENSWIIHLEPYELSNTVRHLVSGNEALKWMKQEFARFKEFLISVSSQPAMVYPSMYDGGNVCEGVLKLLEYGNLRKFEREFLSM